MNIKTWLESAQTKLQSKGIGSSRIDAELILSHVLGKDKTYLIAHSDEILGNVDINQATTLLERRLKDEPIAFLVGYKEFYGRRFKTDSRALIPRWETETLVSAAIEWLKERTAPQTVAEIGTGCGAIIISLALACPKHHYLATEISAEALSLARENDTLHSSSERVETVTQAEKITFLQGNLGEPLIIAGYKHTINLLVANLPYIPSDLLKTLDPTVTYYEPNIALEGGTTGLEIYEAFLPQAQELLAPGGLMLLEHDYDQGDAMRALTKKHFPTATIKTLQDYLGHDRVLYCLNERDMA